MEGVAAVITAVLLEVAAAATGELCVSSVRLYSPGSQQGGVSPSGGFVPHLSPGELGASQPTKRPRPGLQAAVDREPVRQGTGQHQQCCSPAPVLFLGGGGGGVTTSVVMSPLT